MHDGRVNGTLNLSRALGDMEFKRGTQLPPAEQVEQGPNSFASHRCTGCLTLMLTLTHAVYVPRQVLPTVCVICSDQEVDVAT